MAKSTSKKSAKKNAKPAAPKAKALAQAKPAPAKAVAAKPTPVKSTPVKPVAKAKTAPVPVKPTKIIAIPAKPLAASKTSAPAKSAAPKPKAVKVQPPDELPNRGVPPTAVPTDGKPRKNAAGLLSKELEFFRDLLLAKRREIVGDMSSMEREALRTSSGSNLSNLPIHMADMGTDNYEQEFTLGLMEKDRKLLREINSALGKIQDGSYGICEGTGKPISKARLEAQPWAKYSIEYARKLELGRLR